MNLVVFSPCASTLTLVIARLLLIPCAVASNSTSNCSTGAATACTSTAPTLVVWVPSKCSELFDSDSGFTIQSVIILLHREVGGKGERLISSTLFCS